MTKEEIAHKYVSGNHDALTDHQEALDLAKDIDRYAKLKVEGFKNEVQADIRNKLSPIKTLCFMLGKLDPQDALGELILEEIKECEKSVEYLQDFLIKT